MKPILKTLLILTVYELTKYVTEQILISKLSIDDIDYPKDYEVSK
ncbi:transcriptional activator RinB [Staphylococcus casei]|uniref:Transcriptional regulator n=1 Tax=Staphylococcus casei TaxID=201828 RepID=A0ABZ2WBX8_9STAP